MKDLNRVELIGRVGRDPEIRYTPGGHAVCDFSVATEQRTQKNGEWTGKTTWHNVTAWRDLAEQAAECLSKGEQVYVEGRIEVDSWDDRETGKKVYRTKVVANIILSVTELKKADDDGWPEGAGSGVPPEDDIPF